MGGPGRHRAGAALALEAERSPMRVRCPRLEIEVRVSRWVAEHVVEDVVDERQPGAQAGLGRLEHMFVTLGCGPDGMGPRLQAALQHGSTGLWGSP